MPTQLEIFDKLISYLEMGITMGFFTEEEIEDIDNLTTQYYIQNAQEEE